MPLLSIVVLFAVAAFLPLPAFSEESQNVESAAAADPDRRVCRRVQVTGSRVKERICRTQRDWDKITEESNETVDRARESGNVVNPEG